MLDIGRAAFDFVDEIEKDRTAAALGLPAGNPLVRCKSTACNLRERGVSHGTFRLRVFGNRAR
jgi:hypothetical protein